MRHLRRRRLLGAAWSVACLVPGMAAGVSGTAASGTLRVSAAVSLRPALEEAARAFDAVRPGTEIRLNAAASGVLLQQARHGARVDLLISASGDEIDRLVAMGLGETSSRRRVAGNRLVVLIPAGAVAPRTVEELSGPGFDRVALGNPKTAPVGRYARQALRELGIWETLGPRVVFAESARQVLDYVARGEVAAGLAYRTDALLGRGRVETALEIAPDLHAPIAYEGIVLVDARAPELAREFLRWLVTDAGRLAFRQRGFLPP